LVPIRAFYSTGRSGGNTISEGPPLRRSAHFTLYPGLTPWANGNSAAARLVWFRFDRSIPLEESGGNTTSEGPPLRRSAHFTLYPGLTPWANGDPAAARLVSFRFDRSIPLEDPVATQSRKAVPLRGWFRSDSTLLFHWKIRLRRNIGRPVPSKTGRN